MKALVVASEGKFIAKPVNGGGPNPLCADADRRSRPRPENQRTVGVLLTYNKFTYLNRSISTGGRKWSWRARSTSWAR